MVILAIVIVFIFAKCKLSCSGTRENLSHRLTTNYVLEDNAYGKSSLRSYNQPWNFELEGESENYTDIFQCNKMCKNVKGATPKSNCIENCMANNIGNLGSNQVTFKPCQSYRDCNGDELCIESGPYSGSQSGYCVNPLEPGIPRQYIPSLREGYTQNMRNPYAPPQTCSPYDFFNESAGRCEPRFQGVASAMAVHLQKPGPEPIVTLPGTTFPGYGVGISDPMNVLPTQLNMPSIKLRTDS